ncbi:unnamed protein product [Urochloa decumbens]|uniref:Uncharacterized protein n=1 Tax=Urochloa decumbens TaxID=240449 RepID=A0ABC9GJ37_9POAL
MNGKKRARGEENNGAAARAVPPAGSDDSAGATPSPSPAPPAARKTPLLPDAAAPTPRDGEPVAVEGGAGACGVVEEADDDDDDEQVERFYALLANIRAMRGLLPPPYASCAAAGDDAGSRKRLRGAEPPWRPAFRMEDFEVEPPAAPPAPSKNTKPTTTSGARSARSDSGSYKD